MINKKRTKRALLISTLAIVMCLTMLIGSTFAWFTDSVTSGRNVIKSGNLDVVLQYKTNWADQWADVDENTKLFKDGALYEPGYTEVLFLRVANAGSLALKYQLMANIANEKTSINVYGDEFKLSDYLEIGSYMMSEYNDANNYADILMPIMFGSRELALTNAKNFAPISSADSIIDSDHPVLPGETSAQIAVLVLTMPKEVDNVANHKTGVAAPQIDLGINLVATQLTHEKDSFDNQYDKDAEYPVLLSTADELKDAIANGGEFALANDIATENTKLTVAKGKEVKINLNGKTLSGINTASGTTALIDNAGTLSIVGNGTITVLAENPDTDWNPEGFPTYASNTIANKGNLTIGEGVKIENQTAGGGASYAIDNYAGATLTVDGGEIVQSGGDVAIRMNTSNVNLENKVTINGGTITGRRAIWIHIAGSNSAQAPKATLEINGGNLSGTQMCIYSYSYGQSFANTNVTINGGTFTGDVAFGGGYKGDQETVTVTGGTFNGELGRYLDNDGWVDIAKP